MEDLASTDIERTRESFHRTSSRGTGSTDRGSQYGVDCVEYSVGTDGEGAECCGDGYFDDELPVVQEALYGGPVDKVLIQKFNVDLKRRDLLCLDPATWLNDEVINAILIVYFLHKADGTWKL